MWQETMYPWTADYLRAKKLQSCSEMSNLLMKEGWKKPCTSFATCEPKIIFWYHFWLVTYVWQIVWEWDFWKS